MEPLEISQKNNNLRLSRNESLRQQTSPTLNWQFSPLIQEDEPVIDDNQRKTSCSRASETTLTTDCVETSPSDNENRRLSTSLRRVSTNSRRVSTSSKRSNQLPTMICKHPSLSSQKSTHSLLRDNDHILNASQALLDDNSALQMFGLRCRYCLSTETPIDDKLISPCRCSGTSKYVHKTCLEKWLTLRNLNECEVCRKRYVTEWVDRPMSSLSFPPMERRDVVLLFLTIAFYITLIFQFLGVVYVSTTTNILKSEARITTLIGLALGLFWFMIGSITLTVMLYSSECWRKWRYGNKLKVVVLDEDARTHHKHVAKMSRDFDLSLAVPV